jgi:hypothetical protein
MFFMPEWCLFCFSTFNITHKTYFQISLQNYKLLQTFQSLCKTSKSAIELKVLQSNVNTGICLFPPIHIAFKCCSKNKENIRKLIQSHLLFLLWISSFLQESISMHLMFLTVQTVMLTADILTQCLDTVPKTNPKLLPILKT